MVTRTSLIFYKEDLQVAIPNGEMERLPTLGQISPGYAASRTNLDFMRLLDDSDFLRLKIHQHFPQDSRKQVPAHCLKQEKPSMISVDIVWDSNNAWTRSG